MIKAINTLVGFGWIKNETLRKAVRLAFNVGMVLASSVPAAAPVLQLIGVTPGPEAASVAAAVSVITEVFRNTTKNQETAAK